MSGIEPRVAHPIEQESYRILHERVDLSRLAPLERAVVARVVHASADTDYATSMVLDERSLEPAVGALRCGAPVVADVKMVASGLSCEAFCYLDEVGANALPTRTAAAFRLAAARHPKGAIFVVGCAPTALAELVRSAGSGEVEPALVVGMPVGFVGAAESKEALRTSGLPSVSNVGEKGGSAVAAAALNALVDAARRDDRGSHRA